MTPSTKSFIDRKKKEIQWYIDNDKHFVAEVLRGSIERVIAYDKKQQQENNTKQQLTLF